MSLSLLNDRKFFQSVILYEVNNWKPIDEFSENLRKLVGNGLAPKSCSIPELSVESITKLLKDMDLKDVDSLRKDQKFIQSVILYEFLIGEKDKDKLYKKLLRNIGTDAIDFSVFSHWFYQFKNGNYDIDGDSLDSKPPTFSELPMDVIRIIVEKLELEEQLSLRKVSRNLQTAIDDRVPEIAEIYVDVQSLETRIQYDWKEVTYKNTFAGCLVIYGERKKKVNKGEHLKLALDDLAVAMKNPKFQLETFHVELDTQNLEPEQFQHFVSFFNSFNHQLHVKHVDTDFVDPDWSILPYFKPGKLEIIDLKIHGIMIENLEGIAKSAQWRQANELKIEGFGYSLPIERFFHFSRFHVDINSLTRADIIKIRYVLMKSESFVWCLMTFFYRLDFDDFERVFESNFNLNGVLTYKVPDTGSVFEIEQLHGCSIQIQKL